LFKNTNNY